MPTRAGGHSSAPCPEGRAVHKAPPAHKQTVDAVECIVKPSVVHPLFAVYSFFWSTSGLLVL